MIDILRKYENTHELILPRLNSCYSTMTSGTGRGSLIWILGEYGEVNKLLLLLLLLLLLSH